MKCGVCSTHTELDDETVYELDKMLAEQFEMVLQISIKIWLKHSNFSLFRNKDKFKNKQHTSITVDKIKTILNSGISKTNQFTTNPIIPIKIHNYKIFNKKKTLMYLISTGKSK